MTAAETLQPYPAHELLTSTATTGVYSMTSNVLRVTDGFVTINGTDFPLEVIDLARKNAITDKLTSGPPSQVYYEKTASASGKVYLFPVPDGSYPIQLETLKGLSTYGAISADEACPVEYIDAMRWALSRRLIPEFGMETVSIMQMIIAEAKTSLQRVIQARVPNAQSRPAQKGIMVV